MALRSRLPEIRFYVKPETHAELKRRAEFHDRSIAAEAARAVRFYLARYDLADQTLRALNEARHPVSEVPLGRAADEEVASARERADGASEISEPVGRRAP